MDAVSELVNDVHSRLNPTAVARVVRPTSLDDLRAAVDAAATGPRALAVCGGRHAMGGQQFCAGGTLLDTTGLDAVLALDLDAGLVEAEAGIQWPALIDALAGSRWSIRQKQTGADDFSLGGAVSADPEGTRALLDRESSWTPLRSDRAVEALFEGGKESKGAGLTGSH